jgi:hypothetical protein
LFNRPQNADVWPFGLGEYLPRPQNVFPGSLSPSAESEIIEEVQDSFNTIVFDEDEIGGHVLLEEI